MSNTELPEQIVLGLLMFSGISVSVACLLAWTWLRSKRSGFWLRLMIFGIGLYNGVLSILIFLSLLGLTRNNSSLAAGVFVIYVLLHLFKAAAIFLFMLYLLGIIQEPKPKDESVN